MDGYNGWTNYETWVVNLWIDNDPFLYEESRRVVKAENTLYAKEEALKEMVTHSEEHSSHVLDGASMFSDLLWHSLQKVDWTQIIEHYEEDDEEEDE